MANSQNFIAVAAELNRRIERQVLPALRTKTVVDAKARCAGCVEIADEETDLHPSAGRAVAGGGAMTEMGDVVLETRGIARSFPGVKALEDVDFTLRRGRLIALLGENGAGKSTLMNILAGVFPPDSGELRVEGRPVRFTSPRQA